MITTGQRIEIVTPPDQHTDLKPGDRGTVRTVHDHPSLGFSQISVDWDTPSRLMLTLPEDGHCFRIVNPNQGV